MGRTYFAGTMHSLRQPIFLRVHVPKGHYIFTCKFGGPTLVVEKEWLPQTLELIAESARKAIFPSADVMPALTETTSFFKLETGFAAFDQEGNPMPKEWDIKTRCLADFVLCIHGAYRYKAPVTGKDTLKLIVKASQMKVTGKVAPEVGGSRFTFADCLI